jgi:prepilin-type N-terminal cleavage/methylation domain-containing protein
MKKSFTLIEILVAVAIFSLVVAICSGIFISALQNQRRILTTQRLLDQSSFVLEYMSRALRMAKKDLTGFCITQYTNYENPEGNLSKIRFLDYQDHCHEFSKENTEIREKIAIDNKATNLGSATPLTSPEFEVTSLKFKIFGQSQTDNFQPRVTIFLEIQKESKKPGEREKVKIQTTISQRNLDEKR